MKQAYVKDTDTLITGTLEELKGRANLNGFDASGNPEYNGDTEVWWDEQKTVMRDGSKVYLDEEGNEYTQEEIEFREGE